MRRENADPASRPAGIGGLCRAGAAFLFLLCGAAAQQAPEGFPEPPPVPAPLDLSPPRPAVVQVQLPNLPLGVVTFPNGKAINLTVSMGSAAFRQPGDAQGRIWLLTDRGPTIDCSDARRLIGLDADVLCGGDRAGRIYPLAGFVPSIYGVDIGTDNQARVAVFTPLKGRSGRPISGRPAPIGGGQRGEASFALDGKPLPPDPSGVDPEAFVRLSDGSFWIAEEFGPSLLDVGPDGMVRRRLVPANAAADFKDADYEVLPALPPLMRLRPPGRGLEGLALSPDERFLYTIMQAPLANPDAEAGRASRNLRIWKIERETGRVAGQFFYELDEPGAFRGDIEARERNVPVGVTELVAVGEDRLLVVERIEKTARLFVITLDETSLIPPAFDAPETRPTFEQSIGEAARARGLAPAAKTLVLDTDTIPGMPAKIEGVAVLGPDELVLVNDNDFAIDGVRSQMFRVTLPQPALR